MTYCHLLSLTHALTLSLSLSLSAHIVSKMKAREEAHQADKEVYRLRLEAQPSRGGGAAEQQLLDKAVVVAKQCWKEVEATELNAAVGMDEVLGWKRLLQAFDQERSFYRDRKDGTLRPGYLCYIYAQTLLLSLSLHIFLVCCPICISIPILLNSIQS
jgi:hypothetical protein